MTRTQILKAWIDADGDHTHLLDYELTHDSVVLDVGGFYGDWAYNLLERIQPTGSPPLRPRMYIFEPIERFYDALVYRFRPSGFEAGQGGDGIGDSVTVLQVALSGRTGEGLIADEEEGSSMHHAMAETPIKTLDISDFFKLHDITKVDLISMNIEGHEFTLLERMIETGLVKMCDNIQVQFHAFYPNAGPLRNSIRAALSKTHVESYCYPFVWESWRKK